MTSTSLQFLSMDKLNVASERVLFESVMKWYNHKPSERVKCLADVLCCVKLPLLTSAYLLGEVSQGLLVYHTVEGFQYITNYFVLIIMYDNYRIIWGGWVKSRNVALLLVTTGYSAGALLYRDRRGIAESPLKIGKLSRNSALKTAVKYCPWYSGVENYTV